MNRVGERKGWWWYFIIGMGIILTGLVVVALVFFWDKIQGASGYGYAGCFVVSFMAGMTIFPAPALPVVFTLGHKLGPLYIGLVAGLAEALGGITVYLTGAGGGTISQVHDDPGKGDQAGDHRNRYGIPGSLFW